MKLHNLIFLQNGLKIFKSPFHHFLSRNALPPYSTKPMHPGKKTNNCWLPTTNFCRQLFWICLATRLQIRKGGKKYHFQTVENLLAVDLQVRKINHIGMALSLGLDMKTTAIYDSEDHVSDKAFKGEL